MDILHLPHSGRGWQQLLLLITETSGWDLTCLSMVCLAGECEGRLQFGKKHLAKHLLIVVFLLTHGGVWRRQGDDEVSIKRSERSVQDVEDAY